MPRLSINSRRSVPIARLCSNSMRWSFSQMRPSPGEKYRHSLMSAKVGCESALQRSLPAGLSTLPVVRATSAREMRGNCAMGTPGGFFKWKYQGS